MKISPLKYLPLIFLQGYLIITLVLFSYGPLDYRIDNQFVFWSFILSYHLAFALGYYLSVKTSRYIPRNQANLTTVFYFNNILFYFVLVLALISSLINFRNFGSIAELTNPLFWAGKVLLAISNPGEAYLAKMENVNNLASQNKLLNIFLFTISFSKLLLIPMIVFYWSKLKFSIKVISITVSLLPVFVSISSGTNKAVFDYVILYGSSLVTYFCYNRFHSDGWNFKSRKFFIFMSSLCFLGAFAFFGSAIGERGGNVKYIEVWDPLNNITINENAIMQIQQKPVYSTYIWFTYYLTQGYYGFSLSLEQDFNSTYGVGNSTFVARNVQSIVGVDILDRTYQRKIDRWWGESSKWHSFYSHFANDFHFLGVTFICFIISFMMARVWLSWLYNGDVFAGALMSLFSILVIFIPANNQIFGFLDGLSAFFWLSLFWIFSYLKIKF